MVSEDEDIAVPSDGAEHLTLPIMGLDQVIGVIRLSAAAGQRYDAEDVRLLSVVAEQLGAYWALLRLHEVQRTLVAVVSHDLRTPLSVITMSASSLLRQITDPNQSRALERALRNAQRATHIINDQLDVTQARVTGGITINPRHTDLREILIDLVEDQRTSHRERDLRFVDLAGRSQHGHWDPDRLAQLAMNLIGNAIAHGDPTRPVTVTLDADAAHAFATVHNFGPPIPGDALARIFDPFSGRDRQRRRGGGIGLGLYIVDQIARAHDGKVTVCSDEHDGTRFTVALPLPAAPGAVDDLRAPAQATPPLAQRAR
jgi:signal transduction histidine kinase